MNLAKMATETSLDLAETIINGHEEVIESCCSNCCEYGKKTEASIYCVDCEECLCTLCLKPHDKYNKGHTVLDGSEKQRWGEKGARKNLPTETCTDHPGEVLQIFCENHQSLCCHICIAMNHSICSNKKYIPDIAHGISNRGEFKALKDDLKKMIAFLLSFKTEKQKCQEELLQCRDEAISQVKEFRQSMNKLMDRLEQDSYTEIGIFFGKLIGELSATKKSCETILQQLQDLQTLLNPSAHHGNDATLFVTTKKCQGKVDALDLQISRTARTASRGIDFKLDQKCMNIISSLKTICICTEVSTESDVDYVTVKEMRSFVAQYDYNEYTVCAYKDFNIKNPCKSFFEVESSCVINDNVILLADLGNLSLIKINQACNVEREYILNDKPTAVSKVDENVFAVATTNKRVLFYSINKSEVLGSFTLSLRHVCFGLAYCNKLLYITDQSQCVYIYTISGKMARKITHNISRQKIFSLTRHVTTNDNRSLIYIADYINGLIVLTGEGDYLTTFTDSELVGAYGVCVAADESVFICGHLSNNVVRVDRYGRQKLGIPFRKSHGIKAPTSICFMKNSSVVLVTNSSGKVVRFQLK